MNHTDLIRQIYSNYLSKIVDAKSFFNRPLTYTEKILKKDGEFIFEIQYLLKTIKDLTFDNIYHEHVNYWCLLSILHFFKNSEMKVYKVKEVDTHGGSLRVYTTKNKNKRLHKSNKA